MPVNGKSHLHSPTSPKPMANPILRLTLCVLPPVSALATQINLRNHLYGLGTPESLAIGTKGATYNSKDVGYDAATMPVLILQ